jgi:glycyl-tRNA synthetase beta chain
MAGDPVAADYHLWVAVEGARGEVAARVDEADYKAAMEALTTLRKPVDHFFEAVMVNDEDPKIRANRLNLLANLRDVMHLVADFSKVVG